MHAPLRVACIAQPRRGKLVATPQLLQLCRLGLPQSRRLGGFVLLGRECRLSRLHFDLQHGDARLPIGLRAFCLPHLPLLGVELRRHLT